MKKHVGLSLILSTLVSVLLLVSACGSTTTGTNTNTSSQTPLQVLQKSRTAMKQLKSVHLDLKFNDLVKFSGSGTPTTTSGTPSVPQNVTINLTGNGDEVLPNRRQSI